MDMNFDVTKVFQDRLAESMGLDKYQYIMEQEGNLQKQAFSVKNTIQFR